MSEILYKLEQLSPDDPRDFQAENILPDDYSTPEEYDPRKNLLPIRDQGYQGSCVAQSSACAKELHEKTDIGFNEYMSPQFVYNLRTNQDGDGMYVRDSMKILYKYGIVPEYIYPYGKIQKAGEIEQKTLEEAGQYKVLGYAYVNTIHAAKVAILKHGACCFTVPVYHGGSDMWRPLKQGDVAQGGHAMALVGWTKDGFIVRNSWGTNWGDKGYTIFPFKDWGMHGECWTLIDEKSKDPDPRYQRWYWRAWRGIKNIYTNSWPGCIMFTVAIVGSSSIAILDPIYSPIPLGFIGFASWWIIKNKAYLIKGDHRG